MAAHRAPAREVLHQALEELLHLHRGAPAAVVLVVMIVFNAALSLKENARKQSQMNARHIGDEVPSAPTLT